MRILRDFIPIQHSQHSTRKINHVFLLSTLANISIVLFRTMNPFKWAHRLFHHLSGRYLAGGSPVQKRTNNKTLVLQTILPDEKTVFSFKSRFTDLAAVVAGSCFFFWICRDICIAASPASAARSALLWPADSSGSATPSALLRPVDSSGSVTPSALLHLQPLRCLRRYCGLRILQSL